LKEALTGGSHLSAGKNKRKGKEKREEAAGLGGLLACWAPGLSQLGYPSLFFNLFYFVFSNFLNNFS
jgi:hypothetical protein